MRTIINFFLILLICSSCKKSTTEVFQGNSGIYFTSTPGVQLDTLNYSFALQPINKQRDTMYINLAIMGNSSKTPRNISLVAAEGATAKEGTHYLLPKVTLPADSFRVRYPIILFNTEDLKTTTYTLNLKLEANSDFATGIAGYPASTKLTIRFNNQLIRPSYWYALEPYVGVYSNTRYRFMIETLKTSDFKLASIGGSLSDSDLLNIIPTLQNAMQNYVAEHGDLVDESGLIVSF